MCRTILGLVERRPLDAEKLGTPDRDDVIHLDFAPRRLPDRHSFIILHPNLLLIIMKHNLSTNPIADEYMPSLSTRTLPVDNYIPPSLFRSARHSAKLLRF
jgi:hypothetical protein